MTTPKSTVSAKVDPEAAEKIERAADELDMTTSQFVAGILEWYVDQNPDHIEPLYPEDLLDSLESFTKVYF